MFAGQRVLTLSGNAAPPTSDENTAKSEWQHSTTYSNWWDHSTKVNDVNAEDDWWVSEECACRIGMMVVMIAELYDGCTIKFRHQCLGGSI